MPTQEVSEILERETMRIVGFVEALCIKRLFERLRLQPGLQTFRRRVSVPGEIQHREFS